MAGQRIIELLFNPPQLNGKKTKCHFDKALKPKVVENWLYNSIQIFLNKITPKIKIDSFWQNKKKVSAIIKQ